MECFALLFHGDKPKKEKQTKTAQGSKRILDSGCTRAMNNSWSWKAGEKRPRRSAACFLLRDTHRRVTLNPRSCENVMRRALEFLTGKSFVKIRPKWLRYPIIGRNLEIDAWCEELKLACEFQGYQHTTFPNCFHKSYAEFEAQVQRDQFKAQRLKELGYRLLEVSHTVTATEIPSFLAGCLSKLDMLWPRDNVSLSPVAEWSHELVQPQTCTPRAFSFAGCAPLPLVPQTNIEWTPVFLPVDAPSSII